MESLDSSHDGSKSKVAVLMVPFPAQGHLNQLLQFSCLVSSYGLPVYFIASPSHNHQAKSRANGIHSQEVAGIHFHDLPLPPFQSPPQDPKSPDSIPWLYLAVLAMSNLRQPFGKYLQEMSQKYQRVIIVHDNLMAEVVADVAMIENAESYVFRCVSAFCQSAFTLFALGIPMPADYFPELPPFDGCFSERFTDLLPLLRQHTDIRAGDIHNTSREIEAQYLELLEKQIYVNKKSWAIGPMVSTLFSSSTPERAQHKCFEWLDIQEPNSVLFVSFGTTTSLSSDQIHELALGLEQSKAKFLWVLRDADKAGEAEASNGEVEKKPELPPGFEDRVRGVGLVIRDWAPQPEILNHPSTGGFMSHCGWNSCMESITMGVPIAAWPMHSDQPANTAFVTNVLKMGLVVRDWNRRQEVVRAPTIEDVVRRLMATEEGIQLRRRAQELAGTVRNATRPCGASQLELEAFIAHITR